MAKIKEMGDGIVVKDAPDHRTTIDAVMAKGKRTATHGKTLLIPHETFFWKLKHTWNEWHYLNWTAQVEVELSWS